MCGRMRMQRGLNQGYLSRDCSSVSRDKWINKGFN